MNLNKEIRIKSEEDISDDMMLRLVSAVVAQGKMSNEGKSYCYATLFKVDGQQYMVEANDKGKSQMFYVYKKGGEEATALDWLSTHVREEDGLEWNYSINNME